MLITMVGDMSKGMNEQSDTLKLSSLTASVSEAEKPFQNSKYILFDFQLYQNKY
jgi:hypothetical protein